MQRVVRSTLVGLVALASLTACGDKTTIVQPTSSQNQGSVRAVTVTPATANLNVGDQITLAASVNADPSITDRTVTWASSNTAIATVDAAAGTVKAIAAGSATITAASKADPNVKGAALITVGSVANPVVTISTINQTNGFNSVPANLGNVAGQIDVTLNVDPGSQKLAGVDLVINCASGNGNSGKDTVVATQSLAATTVAAAEEAAAPITLSFNTAQFTQATGGPAFFNGACTIKGQARTTAGTTVATANTAITLNNADVVIGAITSTKSASDAGGLAWHGGDVTITTTPVFYSGRVAATTVVTFEGKNQTVTGAGTKTVTFVDANDLPNVATGNQAPAANDIDNITDPNANVTFNLVDAAGNNFSTNPCGNTICTLQTALLATAPTAVINATSPFRLDTQAPKPGRFILANNTDQGTTVNGYIGANFRFAADSAAGYRGPDSTAGNQAKNADRNGVDKVAVTFQTATSITGTFNTVTTTSGLAETNTATANMLRQITTDALGNADTSFVGTGTPVEFRTVTANGSVPATARFGVDVTAPTVTFNAAASISDRTAVNDISTAVYNFSFTDNLSGTGLVYVAQVRNWNGLTGTPSALEGNSYTNTGAPNTVPLAQAVTDLSPCVIGRYNASQAAAGAGAVQAFDRSGAAIGYCTPVPFNLVGGVSVPDNATGLGGYYQTVVIASDEAGNRAPAFTSTVLENPTAPTVANIDLPGSITGNATASFPASVTETSGPNVGDISRSWAQLEYTTVPGSATNVTFQYPITAGPGVAFDNVLTRTATVTPTITNFAKSLTISNGAAAVTAATNNADSVKVFAADPAQIGATTAPNAGSLAVKLAPSVQLVAGSTSSFAAQFTAGFRDSVSSTSASLTGSITLFAIAQGTTGIFNNPFSGGAVTFWYRLAAAPATSPWFFISSTSSGVTQDTGLANGRSWIFTTPFTPPTSAPDGTLIPSGTGLVIRAVGVNANGDAVGTIGTTALTVTP